jgi:hypothetical protein
VQRQVAYRDHLQPTLQIAIGLIQTGNANQWKNSSKGQRFNAFFTTMIGGAGKGLSIAATAVSFPAIGACCDISI